MLHVTQTTVRGYELDSYGHVNNAVYLNYFEHARWTLFMDKELMHLVHDSATILVVTDIHIRYMREAKLADPLEIVTRCVRKEPFLIFRQRLINRDTRLALARAETRTIFLDSARKPVDIPKAFQEVFHGE